MRHWAMLGLLTALTALLGCGRASSGEDTERASAPLCPDCDEGTRVTGIIAETLVCCEVTRNAVGFDDPRAIALGAERYASWIEAGYAGPLEWRSTPASSGAQGYEAATELSIRASVEGLEHLHSERSPTPPNPYLCANIGCDENGLAFDVHVELATADGALAGSGNVVASTDGADEVRGFAVLPMGAFSGTLDLGADLTLVRNGGVNVSLGFSAQGAEGLLLPWIQQRVEGGGVGPEWSLEGWFPVPSCYGQGDPIEPDAPFAGAGGQTAREALGSLTASEPFTARRPGRWLDGATTEISIALAGDIVNVCGEELSLRATVPVHVQTADGRLDLTAPAEFSVRWGLGGALEYWGWSITTEVMPEAALEQLLGSVDVSVDGEDAQLTLSADAAGGSLIITRASGAYSEYLLWCVTGECTSGVP